MTVNDLNIPSADQLIDVVANSSVGILITDENGAVILHNKAQSVLMGGECDQLDGRIAPSSGDGLSGLLTKLTGASRFEDVAVTFSGTDGKERSALVNAVRMSESGRIHWVSRPELGARLPVSNTSEEDENLSDAATWIRAVNEQPHPTLVATAEHEAVMREFFEVAPVAIHLIGVNGDVMFANPADVNLVEYGAQPAEYVGNHIRRIYEDQGLLDDFLNRWDEDSPIINFRANFVTRDGMPKPVLIFSTAQAEGGSVSNTRCFVFSDPEPHKERDTISAFGWPN